MPLVGVDRIIVNPMRCTEGGPSIGTAREHDVCAIAAERADAGYHVNVAAGRAAGTVNSKEDLAGEPAWVHRAAEN
jgi:hypothetical protein